VNPEQELLTKWRSLPQDKQEEVLDFVEFLRLKNSANKTPLGERLRQIRSRIVASGKPLLTQDEIETELAK
jgi:chorismate-pyruvate lyase